MKAYANAPIKPLDAQAMEEAASKIDGLAKPLGSLGRLEEMAVRLAGICGGLPLTLGPRRVVVFAADNGIWEEGISPVPQDVTLKQAVNMTRGLTGICALTQYADCGLEVVDIGIKGEVRCPEILDRKLMNGTNNIARQPAMDRETAENAVETGFLLAQKAKKEGICVLGAGEMGICNTSTSAAVLTALSGLSLFDTVGKGAGLSHAQFEKKRAAIERALLINNPDPKDPLDVLSKVGGLDIGGMAGLFIGAASAGMPAVVDGYIAAVAAILAVRIRPEVKPYLFASHQSEELGYRYAAQVLGMVPILNLGMRLGEGTGCPLAMMMMEAGLRIANDMGSFETAAIDRDDYVDLRKV